MNVLLCIALYTGCAIVGAMFGGVPGAMFGGLCAACVGIIVEN